MTDKEAQIEALWTYEISTEKVLRRAVKKGFITKQRQMNSLKSCLSSWTRRRSLGFSPPHWVRKCGPSRSM